MSGGKDRGIFRLPGPHPDLQDLDLGVGIHCSPELFRYRGDGPCKIPGFLESLFRSLNPHSGIFKYDHRVPGAKEAALEPGGQNIGKISFRGGNAIEEKSGESLQLPTSLLSPHFALPPVGGRIVDLRPLPLRGGLANLSEGGFASSTDRRKGFGAALITGSRVPAAQEEQGTEKADRDGERPEQGGLQVY